MFPPLTSKCEQKVSIYLNVNTSAKPNHDSVKIFFGTYLFPLLAFYGDIVLRNYSGEGNATSDEFMVDGALKCIVK